NGLLRDRGPQLARDFFRLPKNKRRVADGDLVEVAKPDGLMDPAFVEERSVATAQIDQPEFADVLEIDDAMAPRGFRGIQDDGALVPAGVRAVCAQGKSLACRGVEPVPA